MKIVIIGHGIEGKALEKHFSGKGHKIEIRDAKNGPGYLKRLDGFDMIFRSPGIPFLKKEFQMADIHAKLTSATKYFFEKCPCKIIGVTGTKGKGTTASLLYEMLSAGYKNGKVFLGGNIGKPPLEFLDGLNADDLVILELSSFQLQDLGVSPHVAIVLGITPDHLDHHKNMKEYVEAKKNIVRFQGAGDVAVLDMDNHESAEFAKATNAHVLGISLAGPVKEGGFVKVGSLILKSHRGDKETEGIIFGEKGQTALLGDHNLRNILAAATVANIFGVPVDVISRVAREFKPLPHRLEFIKEVDGVRYYNDSASTNPDTTIAAIQTFNDPMILIVGGSSKKADFGRLGREIARHLNLKIIVLMGETKKELEKAIETAVAEEGKKILEQNARSGEPVPQRESPLELISAESHQEAFMVSRMVARSGDIVLLSPACASFDMFTDYCERGDIFRNFVLDTGS